MFAIAPLYFRSMVLHRPTTRQAIALQVGTVMHAFSTGRRANSR